MKYLGKALLTLVALVTGIGCYLADWNETHIYNPTWPPHAKFHNAQTMLFGTVACLLSLFFLWRPRATKSDLQAATAFAAMYWVTQMGSITFPGTSLFDPSPRGPVMPVVLGFHVTQIHMDVVLLVLAAAGYILALRQMGHVPRSSATLEA